MTKLSRKFLEDLGKLEKEEIDSIMDAHSESVGSDKNEIDTLKNDLKVANQTIESLKSDVSDRDKQLDDLKKSDKSAEDLKKEIEDLQKANTESSENHTKEMNELKKSFAIESALRDAKAINIIAAKALLKLDDIELKEDGTLKGLSEQIETLKVADDSKFLFNTESKQKQFKGAEPGETGKEDPDDKVDLSKMTYDERDAFLREHPDYEL